MSNTRTDRQQERDFDGTYPGSSNSDHIPRKTKPYKPLTGKAGIAQANRIDAAESRAAIEREKELGSGPLEARMASIDKIHELRRDVLGHQNGRTAVAETTEVQPVDVPEYPEAAPGEQAKLFE